MISVYYFRHEIVSDIKLIQPEDVEGEKSVNICFMAHEVLNYDIYSDILNDRYRNTNETVENIRENVRSLNMKRKFDVAVESNKIFQYIPATCNCTNTEVFIMTRNYIFAIRHKM